MFYLSRIFIVSTFLVGVALMMISVGAIAQYQPGHMRYYDWSFDPRFQPVWLSAGTGMGLVSFADAREPSGKTLRLSANIPLSKGWMLSSHFDYLQTGRYYQQVEVGEIRQLDVFASSLGIGKYYTRGDFMAKWSVGPTAVFASAEERQANQQCEVYFDGSIFCRPAYVTKTKLYPGITASFLGAYVTRYAGIGLEPYVHVNTHFALIGVNATVMLGMLRRRHLSD